MIIIKIIVSKTNSWAAYRNTPADSSLRAREAVRPGCRSRAKITPMEQNRSGPAPPVLGNSSLPSNSLKITLGILGCLPRTLRSSSHSRDVVLVISPLSLWQCLWSLLKKESISSAP